MLLLGLIVDKEITWKEEEALKHSGEQAESNLHAPRADDYPRITSAELVRAARRGDDQAFFELIRMHKSQLYRMAWTYLRQEQDALEAVQETVCRAYAGLKKLKDERFFGSWLVRILLNVCIDEIRRRDRQSPASEAWLQGLPEERRMYSSLSQDLSVEDRLELEQAVHRLREPEKQIILLKYFEDMTITDISHVLECPPGTIKTRLHRALLQLREWLGKGSEARG